MKISFSAHALAGKTPGKCLQPVGKRQTVSPPSNEQVAASREAPMRTYIVLCVVSLPLLGAALLSASTEPTTSADRAERRFVLFQPGTASPTVVPPAAKEQLADAPPEHEALYSRWVRMNAFDPATAAPGDRVVFHVSPGESFELIISTVDDVSNGAGTIWSARLPDYPYDTLSITFSRHADSASPATIYVASFKIPGQFRHIIVQTAGELPGWGLLKEITPRSSRSGRGSDHHVIDLPLKPETEDSDSNKR